MLTKSVPNSFGLPLEIRGAPTLILWAVLIVIVVIGSLSPGASPLMVSIGRLHINDKVMHFCAYMVLSLLPVIGFRNRRRGIVVGLSMFFLGVLMEAGQHFSPGRAVELGDVVANGAGVTCGVLLAFLIRVVERRTFSTVTITRAAPWN